MSGKMTVDQAVNEIAYILTGNEMYLSEGKEGKPMPEPKTALRKCKRCGKYVQPGQCYERQPSWHKTCWNQHTTESGRRRRAERMPRSKPIVDASAALAPVEPEVKPVVQIPKVVQAPEVKPAQAAPLSLDFSEDAALLDALSRSARRHRRSPADHAMWILEIHLGQEELTP